jgi:hypothetical protein
VEVVVVSGRQVVATRTWESLNDLRSLTSATGAFTYSDDGGYHPDRFFSFTISSRATVSGDGVRVLGLACEPYSIEPRLVLIDDWDAVAVAANKSVVIFVGGAAVPSEIAFATPVVEVYLTKVGPLVETEVGVVLLDETGAKVWGYEHDMVQSLTLTADAVTLKFDDSMECTIDLETGPRS